VTDLLLTRIDDRLIHGQVSVGWLARLAPDLVLVLDDEVAADPWERDLVCSSCPDTVGVEIHPVEAGGRKLAAGGYDGRKVILLLRSAQSAVRLVDAGCPLREINVGGIHHQPGRRSYLPYVYLDDGDAECLRSLIRRGIRVVAQDLPGNRAVDVGELLERGDA
jgi:mannose/fructose/N-acetylgalactosamine-specific phosphotransferase system component IIB